MAQKKQTTRKRPRKSMRRPAAAHHQPLITTRLLQSLLTDKFPFLAKPLIDVDKILQQQFKQFRKIADGKAKEMRAQMEDMLVELTKHVRKNLQRDLKRIEVALRELATRVAKLERTIKTI